MSTDKKDTKYTQVSISGEVEEFTPLKKRKKGSLGVPSHYFDLGMYLAAPLLIAVFVGRYLDERFNKGAFFTILLLIFGTITVFYNLYKLYGSDRSTHQH